MVKINARLPSRKCGRDHIRFDCGGLRRFRLTLEFKEGCLFDIVLSEMVTRVLDNTRGRMQKSPRGPKGNVNYQQRAKTFAYRLCLAKENSKHILGLYNCSYLCRVSTVRNWRTSKIDAEMLAVSLA